MARTGYGGNRTRRENEEMKLRPRRRGQTRTGRDAYTNEIREMRPRPEQEEHGEDRKWLG